MTDTDSPVIHSQDQDIYNIWSPSHRANPAALYARMRAENPVYKTVGPVTGRHFWVVTRYDDAITALKDPRIGKEMSRLPKDVLESYPPQDPTFAMMNRNMLFTDPPDHTRLRGLVHKAFTPRMIENLRDRIQDIASELIDQMEGKDEGNLIEDFAFPLPIIVIAELLGIPPEERERFRAWTRALLFGPTQEDAMSAAMEFIMYFHGLFDERLNDPREDLISGLVQVEENGETLDREELMGMVFLLLVAGHETTVNLIGNGTLALLQHPDQLAKLKADPGLIRNAVEEMLRYNGPVEVATERFVMEPMELGGQQLKVGDLVFVSLIGANHDPDVFPNPHVFDITRDAHKHIAFGNGIHYCLGAPLARLEGTIAISTLLRRLPDLQLNAAVEDLEWSESLLLHGLKALPLRYKA
jgi:cytochrome P450